MKLIKLSCSNCNGITELRVENNQKIAFCQYCGQKYLVDDGRVYMEVTHNINVKQNIRYTNTADVIRAKNEEKVINAKKRLSEAEAEKLAVKLGMPLIGFIMIVLFALAIVSVTQQSIEDEKKEKYSLVSPLESSFSYWNDNYQEALADFENAGFTNVTSVDLNDASFFKKENTVSSITINGNDTFETDDAFEKDAEVIIYYH